MDEKQLINKEVKRIEQEYLKDDLCWDEFSETVHLDPRLGMRAQVKVYSRLCKIIDGDKVVRIRYDDEDKAEYVPV